MGRLLISLGLSLVLVGVLWNYGSRFGFGQLPGDLTIKRGNTTIYIPVVSCVVLSLSLSLLLWLWQKFRS